MAFAPASAAGCGLLPSALKCTAALCTVLFVAANAKPTKKLMSSLKGDRELS